MGSKAADGLVASGLGHWFATFGRRISQDGFGFDEDIKLSVVGGFVRPLCGFIEFWTWSVGATPRAVAELGSDQAQVERR